MSLRHLIDTDIAIEALRKRDNGLIERLRAAGRVGLSSVSLYELRYGAERSAEPARNHAAVDELTSTVAEPLDFGPDAAGHAAAVRAALERRGTPIGPYDLQIAGHARSLGLVLVTRNVGEFERVPSLVVERW
ncbi:MAG: PIN domain-containing protein [Nocardioides sp.]|uniref:PIN domain-containing protein n=1 Tax=Nocardioides sp. TaxID=35761 RepID=UPI0039E59A65